MPHNALQREIDRLEYLKESGHTSTEVSIDFAIELFTFVLELHQIAEMHKIVRLNEELNSGVRGLRGADEVQEGEEADEEAPAASSEVGPDDAETGGLR